MKQSKLVGYVIGRRNLGDSDLIISVFSRDLGKCSFVAKGAKKPRAKLRAHLEPLAEIEFRTVGNSSLPTLVGVSPISTNNFFSAEYGLRLIALYVTEVLSQVSVESQPNQALYESYGRFLVQCLKTDKPLLLLNQALFEIMQSSGIEPRVELVKAGQYFFDYDEGMITARMPAHPSPEVSQDLVKFWKLILNYDKATVMRLRLDRSVGLESAGLINDYLEHHFNRQLKSFKVLKQSPDLF